MRSVQISRHFEFVLFRLLRKQIKWVVIIFVLLLSLGGVAASTYYVVVEQSQWHNSLSDAAKEVPFPFFATTAAQVESVQVLRDTHGVVLHINYVLPDGDRFAVRQEPALAQSNSWEGVTVLDSNVDIGEGGILYMAEYISPTGQEPLKVPALIWADSGVEIHLLPYPEATINIDELLSLASTFHTFAQTQN